MSAKGCEKLKTKADLTPLVADQLEKIRRDLRESVADVQRLLASKAEKEAELKPMEDREAEEENKVSKKEARKLQVRVGLEGSDNNMHSLTHSLMQFEKVHEEVETSYQHATNERTRLITSANEFSADIKKEQEAIAKSEAESAHAKKAYDNKLKAHEVEHER